MKIHPSSLYGISEKYAIYNSSKKTLIIPLIYLCELSENAVQ